MSTYQGECGAEGCSSPVITSFEAQPTAGQNSSLRSAAVIYNETVRTIRAGGTPRFASHTDYLKYKRAQALASGSSKIVCRPPPCDAIRQIEATGCACTTVIDGVLSFDSFIGSPPSPYPDPSYDAYFTGSWTAFPNATSYTVTCDYPKDYIVVFTGATSVEIYLKDYNQENVIVSVVGNNSCSSSNPVTATVLYCFLAGSLVTLADGTTKPIEAICVGDIVLGAFGEANPVLALHYSLLGEGTMMNLNGEHHSTSNHPHISIDKQFYSLYPQRTSTQTYGREHTVINADGHQEKWILHGLRPDRIQTLRTGIHLKTVEGSRIVSSLEEYTLPPDTQLYNLVVGGSHTYHVDGYAVTGWPREDDFDYDSWTVRT